MPPHIRAAYGLTDTDVSELRGGAMHHTYLVPGAEPLVLQHIRNLFDPSIMHDISAVTAALGKRGVLTPRVYPTLDGRLYQSDTDGTWWRALTYVPGRTVESVQSVALATSAGTLIGRFHTALLNLEHQFSFRLPHFHDTAYHIKRATSVVGNAVPERRALFKDAVAFIGAEYATLLPHLAELPLHIIHGDLKISNVVFDDALTEARALIDFDTLMHGSVATELGDALRSWCASGDEDAPTLSFNSELYTAALAGYTAEATFLTDAERASIPYGVLAITLELAARFMADACEEQYFALRKDRYPNLFEQNKVRAQNQLALYRSMSTTLIH